MKQDLVSVIMPAYNAEKYIHMSIASVMRQTYENVELVIVDDASTDHTVKCVKQCETQWPGRIRLFVREKNGGTAAALNDAIELADGSYICWLSADDLYSDDMVESEVKYLKSNEQYDAVFSQCAFIDENNQYLTEVTYESDYYKDMKQGMPGIITLMLKSNLWNGCSLLAKAECFKCGRFNINYPCAQDYDFWLRMAANYDVGYLKQINVFWRYHSEQGSRKMNVNLDEIKVFFGVLSCEDVIKKLFAKMKKKYTLENIMPYIEGRRRLYGGRLDELCVLKSELEKYLLLVAEGKIHFEDE